MEEKVIEPFITFPLIDGSLIDVPRLYFWWRRIATNLPLLVSHVKAPKTIIMSICYIVN